MDKHKYKLLINDINLMAQEEIKIMEVCGTHTQMISKLGIRSVLNPNIKLISGPGCPVCVTEESFIDNAIELLNKNVTVVTFGDMLKVNGTNKSLFEEKSMGKEVRIIYSILDIIQLAENNQDKIFVFLAVGFETTASVIALTIKKTAERKIHNLYFLTSLKVMPPVIKYILQQEDNNIHGLICPGHVASVTGSEYFKFVSDDYNKTGAVCGFKAEDIFMGLHFLVKQISSKVHDFRNLYKRCVKSEGNIMAIKTINDVFTIADGNWRGIGIIEKSSLCINDTYKNFDANNAFNIEKNEITNQKCLCRDVLLGKISPKECNYFAKKCNPLKPYGPCMVSVEGSCAIVYRYREDY